MKLAQLLAYLIAILGLLGGSTLNAASFLFGTNGVRHALAGQANGYLLEDGNTLSLAAGPTGALLDDSDAQGLGIDARGLPNTLDSGTGDRTKFNILNGSNNSTSPGESLSFSFDRNGILQDLLFDGLKDETLEYFSLTLPNGSKISIFDSQAAYRLNLQGFHLTDLNVPKAIECQLEDDDLTGINYSFQAGDVFTLTYGEGDYGTIPGYRTNPNIPLQFPNALGNGARLQGIVVALVPEPAAALLAWLGCIGIAMPGRPHRLIRLR